MRGSSSSDQGANNRGPGGCAQEAGHRMLTVTQSVTWKWPWAPRSASIMTWETNG